MIDFRVPVTGLKGHANTGLERPVKRTYEANGAPPREVSLCFDDHVHDEDLVGSSCNSQGCLTLLLTERDRERDTQRETERQRQRERKKRHPVISQKCPHDCPHKQLG